MMLEWLKRQANKSFENRRENAGAFPASQLNVSIRLQGNYAMKRQANLLLQESGRRKLPLFYSWFFDFLLFKDPVRFFYRGLLMNDSA
jgi:hypothetical protein